jgi:guanylate kinase
VNKLIILTAPSGAGKTTIVRHLLQSVSSLSFSISATTRPRRTYEQDAHDYYFLSVDDFKRHIEAGDFVEWQEVYPGKFYGTLRTEIERLWQDGKDILFDIDVYGALNLQKAFPGRSLSIFIKPPSPEVLLQRLRDRKTENEDALNERFKKAKEELAFENKFDYVVVNDVLNVALADAEKLVRRFLSVE